MGQAASSEGQNHDEDSSTQKGEIFETAGWSTSRTENATADAIRDIEASDSKTGKKESKVGRVPAELNTKESGTTRAGRSRPEDSQTLGQAGLGRRPEKTRSSPEGRIPPFMLMALAQHAYEQFTRTGDIEDIDKAVTGWGISLALSDDSPIRWHLLSNLGAAYSSRFERLGEISDLANSIKFGAEAVLLAPDDDPSKPSALNNLGMSYRTRFQRLGELSDANKAIEFHLQAISFAPDGHPEKPTMLRNLGAAYEARYEQLSELPDLNKAIESQVRAVSLAPDGRLDKPGILNNLGSSYDIRFKRLGELSDLKKVIKVLEQAVSLAPNGHPDKPKALNNLGNSYLTRFQRLNKLSDLDKSIKSLVQAVSLTHDGHPGRSGRLNDLGVSYQTRFERLGKLSDLNKAIEGQVQAVLLAPDGHPEKSKALHILGNLHQSRFGRLGELSDLNKAIESHVLAVALTPDSHIDKPATLHNLGNSYQYRFGRLGELSDVNNAIESQMLAVSLTPDGHLDKSKILGGLGNSYLARFERLGELSDLNKAIESHVQAVSLTSDDHPDKPGALSNLGNSYTTRFARLGELSDLNKAIDCQAQAVSLTPDDHPHKPATLNNIGVSYETRFKRLGELSDLNKSVESKAQAVLLAPVGHPDKPGHLNNLGIAYRNRFQRLGELSDLNDAIESQMQAVSLTPDGHPDKPLYLSNLGTLNGIRFGRLGDVSDLNKAIESQEQAASLTPDNHPHKPATLNNLGSVYKARFLRQEELSDLNKAIEFLTQAVLLAPDGHLDKPNALNNLGNSYLTRFQRLNELSDLNKAIEFHVQVVSLIPDGHPDKSLMLKNLGMSYGNRYSKLRQLSDLRSAVSLLQRASETLTGPPSVRFDACKKWATFSLHPAMPSPLLAYQCAMSLVPQLVWVGTTVSRRYELVADVSSFATEAASYAISTGAYDLALEWLEAGRSIVWGQIAQLRTPFEDLSRHNSKLANDLAAVGRQLESAGSRTSFASPPEASSLNLVQEANTHIQLALEWDRLLKEIRNMPDFEDFLRSPTAARLRNAAKAHPVVVINLHESRCDALILQPNNDAISHVGLAGFSSTDAVAAGRVEFSQMRELKVSPRVNPQVPTQSQTAGLWCGVTKPVLDFLGYTRKLPVDQLPHITWCTTGLLSFLPLHTARSSDHSHPGTFDLVISSYTPTLNALLAIQSADSNSTCGIVAVGQENTRGLNRLPCTTKELAVIHQLAQSQSYLQLEGDEATVERVLDAMDQFSWVHMACHGSQDPDDPTKSAFRLHDGSLTLAAITKRSFTNKGLAFLSACQTATGDKSLPDEAVHLAAGMLMAGYPSVIGTMWSIADRDGPEVASIVYGELLKDGRMNHTNAARALHQAVAHLRAKVGEGAMARWAPFIHIGC